MKIFVAPELQIATLEVEDIITTSQAPDDPVAPTEDIYGTDII